MSSTIYQFEDRYRIFLQDESRYSGYADSISFPQSEQDVVAIINKMSGRQPITVQGSRTGLVGGSVPLGGHILNFSKMDKVLGLSRGEDGSFYLRVQPGVTLETLHRQLLLRSFDTEGWDAISLETLELLREDARQAWPPGPTEKAATMGGIAASNSSGICSYYYGPAKEYIEKVRCITDTGVILSISRGEYILEPGTCPLPGGGVVDLAQASMLKGQRLDLLDLCIGGEGVLGVFSEITLKLEPAPSELWGLTFFFKNTQDGCHFVDSINGGRRDYQRSGAVTAAIEFFDSNTLAAIEEYRKVSHSLAVIPELDPKFHCLVYVELHGDSQEPVEQLAGDLHELASQCECDQDHLWALCGEGEIERLRILRHAAPQAVNLILDKIRKKEPEITKLSTDCSFLSVSFGELLSLYRKGIEECGIASAIFGHAGSKHLHVNLFPETLAQFEKGKKLIRDWATLAEEQGGRAVIEHGVGKIKKEIGTLPGVKQRRRLLKIVKAAIQSSKIDTS